MESLGKEENRAGQTVHQGLTVYGNKGSTDQHAYVQQLIAGPDNFFAVFFDVLEEREGISKAVEAGNTSGDYLQSFQLGTAETFAEADRRFVTLILPRLDAATMGALIALFERTVGFYAEFINVNAYDQPAVERGKTCASSIIDLKIDCCSPWDSSPIVGKRLRIGQHSSARAKRPPPYGAYCCG